MGPPAATRRKALASAVLVTWARDRADTTCQPGRGSMLPRLGEPWGPQPGARAGQHLHVDAPVGALLQGLEGVGAVGWVEVGAGRDGVLPVGLGAAGFAQ